MDWLQFPAAPMVRSGGRSAQLHCGAMDFSPGLGCYLFFCVLFATLSDQGIDWAAWHFACGSAFGGGGALLRRDPILASSDAVLDVEQHGDADGGYVGRCGCFAAGALQCLAVGEFIHLLCLLSLSFVSAAGDFSNYQSDGMLLEAGFISLFFAPGGIWPGWAADHPPSRASLFLLQWEWFRIYFESGLVKLLSGDVQWRNFTAMDEYYQNSPLPTWIGWYVEHLPHWFHAGSVAVTLVMELVIVFLLFFPRRLRLICFFIVTPWEIGVILTSNYAFLNYIVLALGFLLLDDVYLLRWLPGAVERKLRSEPSDEVPAEPAVRRPLHVARVSAAAMMLIWIGYVTIAKLTPMVLPGARLPDEPAVVLEPFRIANRYGLFAVMTRGRYEIEFQGSNDGQNWQPYIFSHKPQLLNERPGIYAPYQPRFDWNLWFASLGDWQQNDMVPLAEEHLLLNDADVLALFRANPFGTSPPHYVRAMLWQYWFTSMDEKRSTGNWWRRSLLGQYAPTLVRSSDGKFEIAYPGG